jgi:sensor histidine kinase regulating citrate/malate metabolism
MSLSVTSSPEAVEVTLDYPGLPVPANDRRVLEEGTETPLNHCNGLALWLVKWIVENGGGRVDLPADEGEPIRVRLERAATGTGTDTEADDRSA